MKILIDTNIFIKVEPTGLNPLESDAPEAIRFLGNVARLNGEIFLHPLQNKDIEGDSDETRRKLRQALTGKYLMIPSIPDIGSVESILGQVSESSHDWIDHHLLAALRANAVDFLVTEDGALRRKSKRLGLGNRTENLSGINDLLERLLDEPIVLSTPIESVKAYLIDEKDPIFDSLRIDYPTFDQWFIEKCKLTHRDAWIIRKRPEGTLGAICIIKDEDGYKDLSGSTLKICTFKVDSSLGGIRLGELLLWNAITFAMQRSFSRIYVTAFPKHEQIIDFFEDFGFEDDGQNRNGERILVKHLDPKFKPLTEPWQFHVAYGPQRLLLQNEPTFIVPIQPQFHQMLFPDLEAQTDMFAAHTAHSNAIRKAYLCHSGIKKIKKGDLLAFYRSDDRRSVGVVGVVEETGRFTNASEIMRFVGKRTVYSQQQIEEMAQKEVLAILFRKALIRRNPISYEELVLNGVLTAPPQSIQEVSKEDARKWLQRNLAE